MEKGCCPVCNGSGRVPAGDNKYKNVIAGYDKATEMVCPVRTVTRVRT